MSKPYNYHKLARQTGFIKKPSDKQRRKDFKDRVNSQYAYKEYSIDILNEDGTIRDVIDKHDYMWGLFYAKGYKPIKLFKSKEEAENYLNEYLEKYNKEQVRYKYAVREILEWSDEND